MLISKEKIAEFIRFCIVGGVATAVHYGLYLLLIHVITFSSSSWTTIAYSIGYVCGFLCNLWLSAVFTFRTNITIKRGLGFVVSNAIMFGLHIVLLQLYLWMGVPKQWAPIPIYAIAVPVNFLLVRFVFKQLK